MEKKLTNFTRNFQMTNGHCVIIIGSSNRYRIFEVFQHSCFLRISRMNILPGRNSETQNQKWSTAIKEKKIQALGSKMFSISVLFNKRTEKSACVSKSVVIILIHFYFSFSCRYLINIWIGGRNFFMLNGLQKPISRTTHRTRYLRPSSRWLSRGWSRIVKVAARSF